ncbi:TIGR04053 family radical SAM/SPASM domain-containing protein [Cryobacterium sinapicolor]|uniref:TIGR04053 family radical SAM/SPASM domain-containing protein n=1 Tax=Cryobacterium sinapicolor TaxID=1259236 RepID=A0ABY2JJ78_9MICO|nr:MULTISPECIES: TIGR04053 family radical SAM/SPASM domain-containing protein [Cryobacterium]TFC91551.1 TIGR04053 family radical SAM/SPASM domain-containing protein [Cryobacterium sp. TMT3-29-2]TFD05041.1 TIGR04053 family radical SAM/SPASM domain-containing protein [Cryobacterium sinapicolor]
MTDTHVRPIRLLHHDTAERPFIVIWEVTRACQLVCTHCRADAIRTRNPFELSTDQGRKLLDDLAAFGTPRPLVVLTGGDPFERPDLPELVAHGTGLGLSMALSPSVTPRLTREVLVELHDAGAKAISLSLDGASAATHDAFRGVDGVFDDTMIAAKMVREVGYRLQINTTVTRDTVHELPGILKTVLELGTTLWSVFFLVPTGRGKLLNALTADEEEEVLHWLHDVSDLVAIKATEAAHYRRIAIQRADVDDSTDLDTAFPVGPLRASLREATDEVLTGEEPRRRRPRAPLDVNSGRGFAFVDHVGLVYPSGFLPVSVGSVHEQPFSEIYREAQLLQELRTPDLFGGRCGHCEFRAVCGGSRSHAYAVTGDPLAEDPSCAYQPSSDSVLAVQ